MHTPPARHRAGSFRRRGRFAWLASLAMVTAIGVSVAAPQNTGAVFNDQAAASGATIGALGTYAQRVQALNPLGYWRLNEAAVVNGTPAVDSSVNGRNGSYVAGTLHWQSRNANWTSGNGYQYVVVGVNPTYTFAAGDRFEYDILPDVGSANQGIDFQLTDGAVFRDSGYTDMFSRSAHATLYSPPSGQWTHRVFPIGAGSAFVGKTIASLFFVNEADTATAQGAHFANIRITDAAGVTKKSIWASGNGTPAVGALHAAVPTGATNTIDWGGLAARSGASPLMVWGGSVAVSAFGGNECEVLIPGAGLDMAAASAFSVEVWVKSNALNANGSGFVSRQKAANQEQYGLDYWSGLSRFYVRTANGTAFAAAGPNINNGAWHHLVGVFSNGALSLYVDGVRTGTASGATGGLLAMPGGTPVTIASRAGDVAANFGPQGTAGNLTEAAIYPVALTAAQVQDHYTHR